MSVITLRTDDVRDQRIAELMEDTGAPDRSAALREAIDLAWYVHRLDRQRKQAERLAADPDDLAEMRAVGQEMDEISAW